ncbi:MULTISPECIES: chaperone NapD [Rhizobium/Agrobacterium group]|jgi:periplasmic nitrate reductase NapD|uniref:chaperone NapD n=1 Tax=Rhizobium/Agrobacterium group TaxID=227290 RepID=UPI00083D6B52|nr:MULTISPECIES: chaperone NapD [Rhizobium/Agrobacterium group]AOG10658.1 napD family protein [Agrobacterium sp. RAC06]QGG91009.1 glutamate synthase [Agrobacterium sp. MA01]
MSTRNPERFHVSSAVVLTSPAAAGRLVEALAEMPDVEVHAAERGKIVIVIEGRSSGEMGATLAAISGLPDVMAANMVFEHAENLEEGLINGHRPDAA